MASPPIRTSLSPCSVDLLLRVLLTLLLLVSSCGICGGGIPCTKSGGIVTSRGAGAVVGEDDDVADKLLSADVDLACDGCSGLVEIPPGSSRRARFLGTMSGVTARLDPCNKREVSVSSHAELEASYFGKQLSSTCIVVLSFFEMTLNTCESCPRWSKYLGSPMPGTRVMRYTRGTLRTRGWGTSTCTLPAAQGSIGPHCPLSLAYR